VKVKRQVAKVKHDAIFCGLKRITPLRVFWMLDSSHGVTYRGALQFEERCDLIWEAETHFESLVPVPRGMDARAEGTPDPNVGHPHAIV
jgi:hypothetical protein